MPPERVDESSDHHVDSTSFSHIISSSRPRVIRGLAQQWPACQLWAGPAGVAHLDRLAGAATVQVMGASGPLFRGDMYSHNPLTMSFSSFLAAALAAAEEQGGAALPASGGSGGSGGRPLKRRAMAAAGSNPPKNHCPATIAEPSTGSDRDKTITAAAAAAAAEFGLASGFAPGVVAVTAADVAERGANYADCVPVLEHLYLAQAPIVSAEAKPCGLAPLQQDLGPLECLHGGQLSSVNLWMSSRGSRSNLHYDPYQNLLCVVRGAKRVRLFSPEATPYLYPMPLYGESPNHSEVDVTCPDPAKHPLYPRALEHELVADLQAADGLYIPEGWWHQVDSEPLTAAVNHWWKPTSASTLAADAAPYHLRAILRVMAERHCTQLLHAVVPYPLGGGGGCGQSSPLDVCTASDTNPMLSGTVKTQTSDGTADQGAGEMAGEVIERRALEVLVLEVGRELQMYGATPGRRAGESAVPGVFATSPSATSPSATTSSGTPSCSTDAETAAGGQRSGGKESGGDTRSEARLSDGSDAAMKAGEATDDAAEDELGLHDAVTRVFAALTPAALRRLLAAAADRFPRTLEALLLHVLQPAAAELMTLKLERDDTALLAAGRDCERAPFYDMLYGVCGDGRGFHALLRQKEAFLRAACEEIMCATIGIDR